MNKFQEYDTDRYAACTFKSQLDKSIHTLEGIIKGIVIDDAIKPAEIDALQKWCSHHFFAVNKHPFNELLPAIEKALEDGILTEEEQKDILWLCSNLTTENAYYNKLTSDMQRLQGILLGIISDGKIEEKELENLSVWLDEYQNLKTCWPYDEVCSLVTSVMKDRKIDAQEHEFLMAYFGDFSGPTANLILEPKINDDLMRNGVCALCPDIEFSNKNFCFTGKSLKASRNDFSKIVAGLGGNSVSGMRKDVNYLVIGNDGNPCWAFSCYGRKVEQAMQLRKEGSPIQLINENDFWDALEDAKL